MRLILARHGNTFGPGDKVVWVGAKTDLPLTDQGRTQAEAIGKTFRQLDIKPGRVIAGPLLRTRQSAELILKAAGLTTPPIEIDDRLTEIDYGNWEGKSSAEIRQLYGAEPFDAWEQHQQWPADANWQPTLAVLQVKIAAFIASLTAEPDVTTLIVSSNGIFRFFGQQLAPDLPNHKMATGSLSIMKLTGGIATDVRWNVKPEDLLRD